MDTIADMLIRIKNAQMRKKEWVEIYPKSKLKIEILKILKSEGFIEDLKEEGKFIKVKLRYFTDGSPLITGIKRVSKPSRRVYVSYKELKPVMSGLGIAIISTPKGILTDKKAREMKVGGELIAEVW